MKRSVLSSWYPDNLVCIHSFIRNATWVSRTKWRRIKSSWWYDQDQTIHNSGEQSSNCSYLSFTSHDGVCEENHSRRQPVFSFFHGTCKKTLIACPVASGKFKITIGARGIGWAQVTSETTPKKLHLARRESCCSCQQPQFIIVRYARCFLGIYKCHDSRDESSSFVLGSALRIAERRQRSRAALWQLKKDELAVGTVVVITNSYALIVTWKSLLDQMASWMLKEASIKEIETNRWYIIELNFSIFVPKIEVKDTVVCAKCFVYTVIL